MEQGPNGLTAFELMKFLDKREKAPSKIKAASVISAKSTGPFITANVSRDSFLTFNNYDRVITEFGVPIVDSDVNEAGEITSQFRARYLGIQQNFGAVAYNGVSTGLLCAGAGLALNFSIGTGKYITLDTVRTQGYLLSIAASNYSTQNIITVGGVPISNPPATLTTPTSNRIDTVWVEVYLQDYGPLDDNNLYLANSVISTQTDVSHRMKVIYLVRVWEGSGALSSSTNIASAPFYNMNYHYEPIAQIQRYANQAIINVADVVDLRPIYPGNGMATILASNSSVFVPYRLIKSTSQIFLTVDCSSTGNAPPSGIYVSSKTPMSATGGFTVSFMTGTAPTGGIPFTYQVRN